MKKTCYATILLALLLTIYACGNNDTGKASEPTAATDTVATTAPPTDSARISGVPCNVTIGGVHFTKSVNGADTCLTTEAGSKTLFRAGAKQDFFCDPNGQQLSNNTAPILLTAIDNTRPFTLTAKVTPGFTKAGLYNAGVLYLYVHDNFWQKFCFEQDERGRHRLVSVRTIGTSDDNNHDVVTAPSVYMKLSSDARTVASYYSLDNKTWNLIRLYKNNYPAQLWAGISNQCPVDTGSHSYFEELKLEQTSVADFRMGN